MVIPITNRNYEKVQSSSLEINRLEQSETAWNSLEPPPEIEWNCPKPSGTAWNSLEPSGTVASSYSVSIDNICTQDSPRQPTSSNRGIVLSNLYTSIVLPTNTFEDQSSTDTSCTRHCDYNDILSYLVCPAWLDSMHQSSLIPFRLETTIKTRDLLYTTSDSNRPVTREWPETTDPQQTHSAVNRRRHSGQQQGQQQHGAAAVYGDIHLCRMPVKVVRCHSSFNI